MAYNVKVYRYPNGWQIRTFSAPIGAGTKEKQLPPDEDVLVREWDSEAQDYVYTRFNEATQWKNVFTGQIESAPKIMTDSKRSEIVSTSRTVNTVYNIARSNEWDWFITLTFNPEKVDSFDYGKCVHKLSVWLSNLRKIAPDMKYIIVPEKHKSGRYHFHGLMANTGDIEFVDSGKHARNGQTVWNIGNYKLGFSTATRVNDCSKVTKYIAKYITKELCSSTFGKKRYWASRNCERVEGEEYIFPDSEKKQLEALLEKGCFSKTVIPILGLETKYFEVEKSENEEENEKIRVLSERNEWAWLYRFRDL